MTKKPPNHVEVEFFKMPQTYDKMGLCFLYPDNWTLDEGDAITEHNSISVYSPNGGFLSVMIYSTEEDPQMLADQVLATMCEEYEKLESSPMEQKIGEHLLAGYEMNFYCLDLTNSAVILGLQQEDRTLMFHYQAEDSEYDTSSKVFLAIITSLLSESAL